MKAYYYMSSLDSSQFEQVRCCEVKEVLTFETGKPALLVKIEPAVLGQAVDRSTDIDELILTARFEGDNVAAITTFPCFVYVCLPKPGGTIEHGLRADSLDIVAWAELYRTAEDARLKRFDTGAG